TQQFNLTNFTTLLTIILNFRIRLNNLVLMEEIKTKQHEGSVDEFINTFANTEKKIEDSYKLIRIMQETTGHPPKMWGPSIIGFGMYHYKSDRSKQEGDWPLVGFSPRKAAISLYVTLGQEGQKHLLDKLGKFTMGKACIYIKKLEDIDTKVLVELMKDSITYLEKKFGKSF